uniref:UTP-monosaccharide-1-phosphate uridylyltransferase n=1 Tax=Tetradesmus obliquus TaxID=3088 RepID=A0A383VCY8_TETOB
MAIRVLKLVAGVGVAAAAGAGAAVAIRKTKKGAGDAAGHQQRSIKMQPLSDDAAEPAAPGTPEPPVRDAEAAPAAAAAVQQEPAAAAAASADPVADALKGNEKLFSEQELAIIRMLVEEGQAHLFAAWPAPGEADADKRRLLQQLVLLDANYHGGLAAYIHNAKQLLADSKEGRNAFDGYTPSVPEGERLDFGSGRFLQLEGQGLEAAGKAAFVLVAGGLGERLGYQGIKVALPCESASGRCFLQLYIESILALQDASGAAAEGRRLPLAIMTSDDTHGRTEALLKKHSNFGMEEGQVVLIKQEKVPCLIDNDAHLALDPSDAYAVQTKPHGHGDVHGLLHRSGLTQQWQQQGLQWVCFFQDTNALVFRALLAALGLSAANDYDMNSLAVPRKAKEAIGAITRLTKADGSGAMTVNVEYNQLDPLLRSTINKDGDVNDESGWSPFPGNINQLVLKLSSYVPQLAATGGNISEFVNPKYKDATKTAFKSSTRLECMMQDYPKALPVDTKVGFTVVNQVWATYSPVKNSPADARAKAAEGNPTHSATTGEMDIYKANCEALMLMAGADVGSPQEGMYIGIPVEEWPRVVLSPSFAPCLAAVKDKVAQGSLLLAPKSVLLLEGRDISVKNLRVDGALVVRAVPGAKVVLDGLTVSNQGWSWTPIEKVDSPTLEEAIRGFRVIRNETLELVFDQPGDYIVPQPAAAAAAADEAPAAEVPGDEAAAAATAAAAAVTAKTFEAVLAGGQA